MIYTNDPQAIRDAKKDVDDAKLEIQKQSIQDQIDALDDEIDRYNDLIDQINKAADDQIDALEKIKNKWQEVIDQQEYAKNVSLLTGEFGTGAITKILTGNDDDLLAQWKDNYINTLADIDMESQGYIGDMTEQIASLYNVDLTPLQSQFMGVKDSVNDMTDALGQAANAVGIGNVSDDTSNPATQKGITVPSTNTEPSLESAIVSETETAMNAFDQHTDKLTNEIIPAIQSATQEMNTFNESADMDIEKTITIHYETTGEKPSGDGGNITVGKAHADGTTGKAFADGSNGLKYHEKNALRSEYGQPELTVYPDGGYEITDTPTISDLPKGTVIYNEEQTKKIMDNKLHVQGKAYADGTAGGGKIVLPDGQVLIRVPDDSPLLDLRRKADAYLEKYGGKLEDILKPVNAIQHHFDEIKKLIDNSTYNNVVNNNNNQPNISFGDIHVHCPGLTSNDVAILAGKQIQDVLLGMPERAYQRTMRTR